MFAISAINKCYAENSGKLKICWLITLRYSLQKIESICPFCVFKIIFHEFWAKTPLLQKFLSGIESNHSNENTPRKEISFFFYWMLYKSQD